MREEIYYKELVERYKSKKASDEELAVFFHLLKEGQLDQYIGDSFKEAEKEILPGIPRAKKTRIWQRVAVAASLAGIISLVVFLFQYKGKTPAGDSTLAKQETKEAGTLYNTVSTKRGEQSHIVLPDGTHIWINAASTVRYAQVFSKERVVELDGECYFEVVKNASVPFRVKTPGGAEIRVLGTHFNVQAYHDEPASATLLEGSIEMQSHGKTAILKPGQKASIDNSGELKITSDINSGEALAWKNGFFQFDKADILTVMRQIEKWYDVEVVYEGKIPNKQFVGKVSRSSDITEVLEILRLSKVNFRMEGKKIIIMP